jgi:hypothetical protein
LSVVLFFPSVFPLCRYDEHSGEVLMVDRLFFFASGEHVGAPAEKYDIVGSTVINVNIQAQLHTLLGRSEVWRVDTALCCVVVLLASLAAYKSFSLVSSHYVTSLHICSVIGRVNNPRDPLLLLLLTPYTQLLPFAVVTMQHTLLQA